MKKDKEEAEHKSIRPEMTDTLNSGAEKIDLEQLNKVYEFKQDQDQNSSEEEAVIQDLSIKWVPKILLKKIKNSGGENEDGKPDVDVFLTKPELYGRAGELMVAYK